MLTEQQRLRGQQLLDEQLWYLGRDIVSISTWHGNLLQQRGAVKSTGYMKADTPVGHLKTQYEFWGALGGLGDVFVWAFGVWFGTEHDGVWISRADFQPRRTQGEIELFEKDASPADLGLSSNTDLLLAGLDWFVGHELWIEQNTTAAHQSHRRGSFPRVDKLTVERLVLSDEWAKLIYSIIEQRPA